MLVPITRSTLEELIPATATGAQYVYVWDGLQTFVKRVIGSIAGVFIVWLFSGLLQSDGLALFLGIFVGLYWLWAPVAKASFRNNRNRRYPYAGFWQGRILDVYVTEEIVGTEETTNQYGELVIVENRERRLNLEVGDRTGFETLLQVPLQKQHKLLGAGLAVQMIVLSETPDLSSIAKLSDMYVPSRNLWVSDYPVVRHDAFVSVSQKIVGRVKSRSSRSPRSESVSRSPDEFDRPDRDRYGAGEPRRDRPRRPAPESADRRRAEPPVYDDDQRYNRDDRGYRPPSPDRRPPDRAPNRTPNRSPNRPPDFPRR
jgi:hypothetical protein